LVQSGYDRKRIIAIGNFSGNPGESDAGHPAGFHAAPIIFTASPTASLPPLTTRMHMPLL
jgi:hypothetical protein